jgi:hypothetical protein
MIFHAVSLVLGIPSLLACMFFTWESVRFHLLPNPSESGPSGDQLIDLFVSGFRLFGKILALFGGAVQWALLALAVASFLSSLFALILFFTARGIEAGRPWARILGILLALVPLFCSLAALTALDRSLPWALAAITAVASVYVIWTLGWRFI